MCVPVLDPIEDRQSSRKLGNLTAALKYLAPYRWYVAGASLALIVTASVTLSIGQGVRLVIDAGFTSGAPGRTLGPASNVTVVPAGS